MTQSIQNLSVGFGDSFARILSDDTTNTVTLQVLISGAWTDAYTVDATTGNVTLNQEVVFDGTRSDVTSATADAVASDGTITTAGVTVARVLPAAAVTGVILEAGTVDGQVVRVVNENTTSADSVTFAAVATSNVADGTSDVIDGLAGATYVWNANAATPAWYKV